MTLGEKLRSARQAQKMTTSEVATATRMKVQMVEALEEDDFTKMPAVIYAKGFIKLYAEHVGLDPHPLVEEYVVRFVTPKVKHNAEVDTNPAEQPPEEKENADSEEGLLTRIGSFFKKQDQAEEDNSEEQSAETETQPLWKSIRAQKTEMLPVHDNVQPKSMEASDEPKPSAERTIVLHDAVAEPHPIVEPEAKAEMPITAEPELAPKPKTKTRVRQELDQEPDLFSQYKAEPEPVQSVTAEPVQVVADPEPVIEPLDEPGQEDKDPVEAWIDMVALKAKAVHLQNLCIGWWNDAHDIFRAMMDDLRIMIRRLKTKIPDWRTFELSLKSPLVMIVLLILIILLISGLSSLVRRHSSDKTANSPAVETHERLRIAIEPPSPYYK